ncbi:hypothetical protein OOZ35_07380 [Mesoflavibacter profundi]|uniref:Uncharacterized protein n=1 Tax=Mesoflavibacter profundi TaxID=2708110 RepID=A0ABT4S0J9_9FLAO|nr:hypothetical protein [Mesoflavibacter profundi]MDA0177306.1 hypothetical protein [Mesoflavibacter profundi]
MKKNTRFNGFLVALFFCFSTQIFAQVGVGTTTPRGALDISSSDQGFIPPQVALTALNVAAPVVNPQGGALTPGTTVWNTNTAGAIPNNVSPGMYYWDGTRWVSLAGSPGGLDWSIIGNGGIDGGVTGVTGVTATQGTHFIGTYDATNFDIRTSGLHAARVSSLGEFFIGALETVLPGDLMNGVSEGNAVFPWAINGYTDQDGAGVYGRVSGGTTNYGAVQGEYSGTGTNSAGVRGIIESTIGGVNNTTAPSAVKGDLFFNGGSFSGQDYSYAIFGGTLANSGRRVGGVHGWNLANTEYGILGYERSNGNNVAVLGSGNYSNSAYRIGSSNELNTSTGLAIQGGFLGGHVKGNEIGFITKGDKIGQYTDGLQVSTKAYAVVKKDKNNRKTSTYASTSTTIDISTKGTGKLVNGEAYISFKDNFSSLVDQTKPIIVTASPMGESNGVYVAEVTDKGFKIKENNNGNSNTNFYWIAIGEQVNTDSIEIPKEILDSKFDDNLDSFLTIDESAADGQTSKAMWWNGNALEFGDLAPREKGEAEGKISEEYNTGRKGKRTPKKENLRASQLKKLQKN